MPSRMVDTTHSLLGHLDIPEADPIVQRLQDDSFSPVDFLNSTIPSFAPSNGPQSSPKSSKVTHIQDTATQVQALLAKLNTQNIRFSNTLSQLTDEILRSGSRLAYEVELLRADANGLHDVFTDTLQDDVKKLCLETTETVPERVVKGGSAAGTPTQGLESRFASGARNGQEPDFIPQLRMLSQLKARLEEVIGVFGEAMEWPLAPSETSIASSLISVSAPESGSDTHTREQRAREAVKRLRSEVTSLLENDGDGYASLDAAVAHVESLRSLTTVWKGTAEEKARTKFVDSLARLVDERRKVLDASQDSSRQGTGNEPQRPSSVLGKPAASQGRADRNATDGRNQSGGLLRNLQRLRDDFYLD